MHPLRRAQRLSAALRLDWPSCSWEWYSWHFARTQWPLSHRPSTKCSLYFYFSLSLSIYGGSMASGAYGLGRVSIYHACLPGRPSAALFCSLAVLDWYRTDSMTSFVLLKFGLYHINWGRMRQACATAIARIHGPSWSNWMQCNWHKIEVRIVSSTAPWSHWHPFGCGTFVIHIWNFILKYSSFFWHY